MLNEYFNKKEVVNLTDLNKKLQKEFRETIDRTFPFYGNSERSLIGQKWFYVGENEDSFSFFYDEVVAEDEDYVFVEMRTTKGLLYPNALPVSRKNYYKIYPIQSLFASPMEIDEARFLYLNQ